jgi:two-component system, NarL family, nitrate/nitrite response regulator NarL
MNIIVMTPVRLFGDGLGACLASRANMTVRGVVNDFAGLRAHLTTATVDVVLIDVTQAVNLFEVHSIAALWPDVALVALGLQEQKQEVIRAGRAGFTGYVSRDASIDALCRAIADVRAGRLAASPEISGSLLRALFQDDRTSGAPDVDVVLTRRECEVLALLGQGLSNKEIGNELCLSVATVKHHVHHVLEKLQLPRRAMAMRKVRETPWLANASAFARKQ